MSKLKRGYTTGTCAAIASKAAVRMLLSGQRVKSESVITPSGEDIEAEIYCAELNGGAAVCAVRKNSGDDPDVTDGMLIYSTVTLNDGGISIDGGEGVGRITRPGLQRRVGEAAINNVPRKMIADSVTEVLHEYGAEGGADVLISVPGGQEIAEKTFNPRLGIEGGISILGTTGIVEPMSTRALIDTIDVELSFKKANGTKYVIVTPGNYGRDYIMDTMGTDIDAAVKCSNFIGETIDLAAEKGFNGMLLIGHAGKLIKLAAGIMNTHSRVADGRAEIICAHAALMGAPKGVLERIMGSVTVDEASAALEECGLLRKVMKSIGERIDFYLNRRCANRMEYAFIVFSNVYGELCRGGNEDVMREALNENLSYRHWDGKRKHDD